MQLDFAHRGLQFFFVTLTLEGRPQALSRLVESERRAVLLPPGETARALLRAFHAVFPGVTVSDYAIMPDHLHFLLIADYSRMPGFNPLWASFILMDAIEMAWLLPNGRGQAPAPPAAPALPALSPAPIALPPAPAAPAQPAALPPAPAALSPTEPDLIEPPQRLSVETARQLLAEAAARGRAFAAKLTRLMREQGLSRAEALAKLGPERVRAGLLGPGGVRPSFFGPGCGGGAPVRSVLRFDRRAYIELSFDARQLKAIRLYIRLNPARALWKRLHPDRFTRFPRIAHAVLDPSRAWSAMGNLTLLGSPFLLHVRLSLKRTLAEHEPAIAEIVEKAKQGVIPVSGFISPGEAELLRRLKATPGTRFIKMLPHALPPRYDPSAEDSRELAADRLLLLSGFSNTAHISALEMRRDPAACHLFRANCLKLNALAAELCEKARQRQ